MQALPPRLGRLVERLAGQPAAEVVAGQRLAVRADGGELADELPGQIEVAPVRPVRR